MIQPDQIRIKNNKLSVLAPAKLNLSLLIAGKRPDGYHEIKTLMAGINWYDQILFEPSDSLEVISTGLYWAPQGKENLIYTACEMFFEAFNIKPGIKVTLIKNIPAGTGLGSASSDAAATLLALKKYFNVDCSDSDLFHIAAKLGSDVPFFLGPPQAICTGRGEKITEIGKNLSFCAVLVLPDISVSTKMVYSNYKHNAELFEQLNCKFDRHIAQNNIDLLAQMCTNMLESSCFQANNELADLKTRIEHLGIKPLCLSGSGSAMFLLLKPDALDLAMKYRRMIEEETGAKAVIVFDNQW